MLNNRAGILFYHLLRNDWTWSLLSEREKQIILDANDYHNNKRPDYANPDLYQGGRSFDSSEDRTQSLRGRLLQEKLDAYQPATVLEIGPASGYLTRSIVYHESVKKYIAVDINGTFLEWLSLRLERVKETKPSFEYHVYQGDFKTLPLPRSEAVILLAAVHHIPDRLALFQRISKLLSPNGVVFAIEPSHYFPRIYGLIKKYIRTYHKPEHWRYRPNLSTHHYCTWEEYKKIEKKIPNLEIKSCCYYGLSFPIFTRKFISRLMQIWRGEELNPDLLICRQRSPLRFFSSMITVEFLRV